MSHSSGYAVTVLAVFVCARMRVREIILYSLSLSPKLTEVNGSFACIETLRLVTPLVKKLQQVGILVIYKNLGWTDAIGNSPYLQFHLKW